MNPSHPDYPALLEMEADLETLRAILEKYQGRQPPESYGAKTTLKIFMEAQGDAIGALKSLCEYLESKPVE